MNIKKIRVYTAYIVFTIFLVIFLNGDDFTKGSIAEILLYFQFIPSLAKFIGGLISIGFLTVIVLTIVFGRVYCSFICPLGIFQDIIIYFSGKVNAKKKILFYGPGILHAILY